MERKLATVLFADLVESTALVAGTDPEVVRRRVRGFFEQAAQCIEQHGGIVEKFAGDAVMAAFGVPLAHEDDAERAVRAGLGILESVHDLGLNARIGVEAGEVVTEDDESTFATGEAVHIAARLQQAAAPGQVLIGPSVHRLTLGRVRTEEVGSIELRGLDGPIWARRALGLIDGAARRASLEAPLVGREAELELLQNTFGRAARDRRAHLVTVYGDPGVGKSRLTREFTAGLERTTVLTGRCLPYGEGITYWPLAEMVKTSAGIADDDPLEEAFEKLCATCEVEAVADLLGLASGIVSAVESERSRQELAWAARAWAQKLAEVQPLVLVFEDIHWAEEPLLDLIEHLAAWTREAPLLLLCLARTELLDVRRDWAGGRVRAASIQIEPLGVEESDELIQALLDGHEIDAETRDELLEKTEGNPLFVEETIRMLLECEAGEAPLPVHGIPDTLQALIAARIDRLPRPQRTLLQRGSVIGRTFWSGAVAHIAPELDGTLEPALEELSLREFLVEEPRSTISGERAFRFKHVLIREIAYAGLAKSARAEHHRRFAEWLKERAGEELLEIRAYHLDRAYSLLVELDGSGPPDLGHETAAALEKAGKRALAREANASARKLLQRSVELEPTLTRRYKSARAAWQLGDLPTLQIEMDLLAEDARQAGDREIEARALTALAEAALYRDSDVERARDYASRALEVAEGSDHEGRFGALDVHATIGWWKGELGLVETYERQAVEAGRAAKRPDLESRATLQLGMRAIALAQDDEAGELIDRAMNLADESGSILARAHAASCYGDLLRIRGDYEEAQAQLERALELFTETGTAWGIAHASKALARLAWERGNRKRAEKLLREAIRVLTPVEERGTMCEVQRLLAQVVLEDGRIDEAERLALAARKTVGPEDVVSRGTTQLALAQVRAAQARDDEAEDLFRAALEVVAATEYRRALLEVVPPYAEFLRERSRDAEADQLEARIAGLSRPLRSAVTTT